MVDGYYVSFCRRKYYFFSVKINRVKNIGSASHASRNYHWTYAHLVSTVARVGCYRKCKHRTVFIICECEEGTVSSRLTVVSR